MWLILNERVWMKIASGQLFLSRSRFITNNTSLICKSRLIIQLFVNGDYYVIIILTYQLSFFTIRSLVCVAIHLHTCIHVVCKSWFMTNFKNTCTGYIEILVVNESDINQTKSISNKLLFISDNFL